MFVLVVIVSTDLLQADFFGSYGTISLIDIDGDTAYITFDNWEVRGV